MARLKKLDSRIENCYGYKEHFYRIMEIDEIIEFKVEFEGFIEKLESSEIKVIKRVSYGIKKFKTLEKLIQLRIS